MRLERAISSLGEGDRGELLDRLHRARHMIGSVDSLERFRRWEAPEER